MGSTRVRISYTRGTYVAIADFHLTRHLWGAGRHATTAACCRGYVIGRKQSHRNGIVEGAGGVGRTENLTSVSEKRAF